MSLEDIPTCNKRNFNSANLLLITRGRGQRPYKLRHTHMGLSNLFLFPMLKQNPTPNCLYNRSKCW